MSPFKCTANEFLFLQQKIWNIYGKHRADWVFAGGHREPRRFSRWMRSTCARLIPLLLSVMKWLAVKAPDHSVATPEYPRAGRKLFVLLSHCWILSQRVSSFVSSDVCIWVFRQWITKCQVKQKMKQRIPSSLYLLLTGCALQKLSTALSNISILESSSLIVWLCVVTHGWNSK